VLPDLDAFGRQAVVNDLLFSAHIHDLAARDHGLALDRGAPDGEWHRHARAESLRRRDACRDVARALGWREPDRA